MDVPRAIDNFFKALKAMVDPNHLESRGCIADGVLNPKHIKARIKEIRELEEAGVYDRERAEKAIETCERILRSFEKAAGESKEK